MKGSDAAAIRATVERWIVLDPDPETRSELAALIAGDTGAGGWERAETLFAGRIAFGTAGLRAEMGPGPTLMNRVVVQQTTEGLMRWLAKQRSVGGPTVMIGYDARHRSAQFAADVANVVTENGGTAILLPGPIPTPVLALAVIERSADAGVMITASHNPAADNGYKLYLADGIQLIGPADTEIAAEIDLVAAEGRSARAGPGITLAAVSDTAATDGARAAHVEAAVAACVTTERNVRVLYTAMHGVGGSQIIDAFATAAFPPPEVVAAQFEPDPDFPTVPYPNPEEPGALDLAIAQAVEADNAGRPFDVILANDPDADRLAAAVPNRARRWERLSGDEVGALLADHLIGHTSGSNRLVASSIVSSRLISAIAASEGVEDVRTLTGFKWVARPIVDRPDARYVFGYEEALGYCVGDRVRDKDGISAALVMAELVAGTIARGETLEDRLDALACRHGVHITRPVTLRYDGTEGERRRGEAMAAVRASPPSELGAVAVSRVEDLLAGSALPPTDGIVLDLVDRSRVVIRPSGTEPKLKAYLEVIEPVLAPSALDDARAIAERRLDALVHSVEELLAGPPSVGHVLPGNR